MTSHRIPTPSQRRLLRLFALFSTLVGLTLLPAPAHAAENLIKRPGAHPAYKLEVEPHIALSWARPYAGVGRAGFGPGVRFSIPFMHNGPISTINNNLGISFGIDTLFPSGYNFVMAFPVAAQWNFFFTDIISVIAEAGFVGYISSYANTTVFDPDPYIQGGGRFQFGKVGLVVRLGYPGASVGANFQF